MIVIDLARYQGASPPLKALRDQHGVGGVIIQYNDGTGIPNPDAAGQHRIAVQLGLQIGCYLFAEASQGPDAQLVKTLQIADSLGGMADGAHVFVDVEGSGGFGDPAAARTFLIDSRTFIEQRAPKWVAGAYASDSFFRAMGAAANGWNGLDIWDADYGGVPSVANPYGHQYTDSYAGAFDASIFPSGIIRHPIPSPTGQMTHALWVNLLNFLHSHYAPANWGADWAKWTADPALAYQICVDQHLT